MKTILCLRHPWFIALACILLTGCLFKRTTDSTRHFVLTPIPANDPPPVEAATQHLSVEIAFVRMPSQLLRDSVVVRNGENEIEYLENALWADRLDHSFERTLAVNLSRLLSSDGIYLADWGRGKATAKVCVNVQQFEVDTGGKGTLIAQWRITVPENEQPLKSGLTRLARTGDSPSGKPEVIATTLSELEADFSRELAESIRESAERLARVN